MIHVLGAVILNILNAQKFGLYVQLGSHLGFKGRAVPETNIQEVTASEAVHRAVPHLASHEQDEGKYRRLRRAGSVTL